MMFPLQPSDDDELVFGNPSFYQPDKSWDDLTVDYTAMESNIINFSTSAGKLKNTQLLETKPQQRQISSSRDVCINDNYNRRVWHRDIERKRRQEMSSLYASLRNLLPLEHIKGKRSMCDHMHEAVNYIKHLQKNNGELQIRREKLKKLCNSLSGSKCGAINGGDDTSRNPVTVNIVQNGVEILIRSSCDFGISRVLGGLIDRDVKVISCVSTKANGMSLHKIQAETDDLTSLNAAVLQETLRKVVID